MNNGNSFEALRSIVSRELSNTSRIATNTLSSDETVDLTVRAMLPQGILAVDTETLVNYETVKKDRLLLETVDESTPTRVHEFLLQQYVITTPGRGGEVAAAQRIIFDEQYGPFDLATDAVTDWLLNSYADPAYEGRMVEVLFRGRSSGAVFRFVGGMGSFWGAPVGSEPVAEVWGLLSGEQVAVYGGELSWGLLGGWVSGLVSRS